jgi:hypothetical protein
MVALSVIPRTLFGPGQLTVGAASTLAQRIQRSTTWLHANLVGRDLIFLGFWSDWAYLNKILVNAIGMESLPLVVLVNPDTAANLEPKRQNCRLGQTSKHGLNTLSHPATIFWTSFERYSVEVS